MRWKLGRRSLILALLIGAGLSCGREITGPGGLGFARGFSFVARFLGDMPASVAGELVPFERVAVVLRNAAGAVVLDRLVNFPSDASEVSVSLDVPLSTGTGAAGEPMLLSLAYLNSQGDTVFSGEQTVTVVPSAPGSPPPPPAEVPVAYSGPGASATAVTIAPRADTVIAGDAFVFTAQAADPQGPIAAPIAWRSLDPSIAQVSGPGAGSGSALPSRGTARIVAQLLTGPADTVSLIVRPRASALTLQSGGGQSANFGAPLANPVVVRVTATDGLGLEGVVVSFAASGDGSVNVTSAVTDANGLAPVLWTLGGAIGAQTLTATATGLTGSPLTITATATEPPLTLLHRYSFSAGLTDAVGGVTGVLSGEGAVSDGVLSLDGVSGFVEFPSRLVPFSGSYSISLFVRSNGDPSSAQAFLSQGEVDGPSLSIGRNVSAQLTVSDALVPSANAPNPDGLFHHVAVVVNAAAGTTTIWRDGVQVETYQTALLRSDAGTNTRLGRGVGVLGQYFGGDLDEVRIYQGALSTAQIATLYADGVTAPGVLVFEVEPSDAEVGSVIAPAIRVRALDALGRLRTAAAGNVTLRIADGPASAELQGTLTRPLVGGVATFNDIAIDTEGSFVLEAELAGSVSAVSDDFVITSLASVPTQLVFLTQPSGGNTGNPLSPIVVEIRDANGQRVLSASNTVVLKLGNNPSGAALLGQEVQTAVEGRATFTDLEIDVAGIGYTLVAESGGLLGAESSPFTITGAGATQLAFVLQPVSTVVGVTLATVTVEARTALGVIDPNYTGAVTIALGANPGGATLNGTLTVNAVAGVAAFTTLSLSAAGAGYTLVATASGLSTATSEQFAITTNAFTNAWTNPDGGSWSTASNWSLARVPTASDTVLIALDGTYTVTMDVNFTGSLVIVGGGTGVQTLSTNTRTLSIANQLRVEPTGVLRQRGMISGAGSLLVNGRLDVRGLSTIQTALVMSPDARLEVRSDNTTGTGSLTVSQGFTNAGRIELVALEASYTTQLVVQNGTLVNAATGVIRSLTGFGTRLLAAQLDNRGTFEIDYPLSINRSGAQHVNTGTIPLTAANLSIVQSGTDARFTNLGVISLAPGRTLTVSAGTVDFSQGVVSGDSGIVALTGAAALTLDRASSSPRYSFGTGTVLAEPYTIALGDSVRFSAGLLTGAPLTVEGELLALGSLTVNAPLVTTPTSRITVRSDNATSSGSLTVGSELLVRGALDIVARDAAYISTVTVNSGALVIAEGAVLGARSGPGQRTVNAAIVNDGAIELDVPMSISRAGVQHLNRGTISLATQNLILTQSGEGAAFVNEGAITIGAGRTFAVTGGTLDLTGGTLVGEQGTLSVNGVVLRTSPSAVRTRYQFSGTGSVVDPYAIPAGDSLKIIGGTWTGPGLTINGHLIATGITTLNVPITTTADGRFEARSSNEIGGASITVVNGFANIGLLELAAFNAGYTTTLAVTNGTLVNEASGVLRSVAGTGSRVLAAEIDNRGLVDLLHPLTINRTASQHANSGSIPLTTQNLTITQSGASPSFTNTGIITLDAGRTLTVTGGTLDVSTGSLSGEAATLSLTNVSLIATPATMRTRVHFNAGSSFASAYTIPAGDSLKVLGGTLTAPGLTIGGHLIVGGSTTIAAPIATTQEGRIEARSSSELSSANITVVNGFANVGLIELNAINGGFATTLAVTNGTLVNEATGVLRSVSGTGSRTLAAQLDNRGLFEILHPITLSRASAQHLNSGAIPLTTQNLTITQTGSTPSFTNTGNITMDAGRTLTVTGGTLDLDAGTLTGDSATLSLTNVTLLATPTTVRTRYSLNTGTSFVNPYTIPVGDSLKVLSGTLTAPGLTIGGHLIVGGTTTIAAPVTTTATGRFEARSSSELSSANITVVNGFANVGLLEMNAINGGFTTTLTVTNGTLVNEATGVLRSVSGTGSRTLAAQLDNRGLFEILHPITLSRASAQHLNSGAIPLTTQNLTITQTGSSPSFTNTGSITLDAGRTLTVTGGTLDLSAGTLTGEAATLSLTNVSLLATPTTVRTRYSLNTGTSFVNPYTIPSGDSLKVLSGTLAAPSLTIAGHLIVGGTTTITAPVITTPAGRFEARSSSELSSANITVANGFANVGLLEMNAINGGFTTTLTVTNGTLVNEATGVLRSVSGTGSRTLAAQLDNRGLFEVLHPITLNRASAQHLNSGSIPLTTQNLTITQTGTSPSFTNTGSITMDAGRTLSVTGGTLDLNAGTLLGEAATLSLTNVSLLATPTTVRTRYSLNTGTSFVNPYTIPVGDSLKVLSGTLTAPGLTIGGHLIAGGTTTIAAPVTTTATGRFEARSSSELSSANITVVNGFANVGLLEMNAINGGFTTTFTVTNGTLVNEATGVLRSVSGTGSRTLAAQLDNRGLFEVLHPITLNRASAQHLNSGSIPLTTQNLTVTQTGTSPSFTNTGTITLEAGRTLSVTGGTLDLSSGLLTGEQATLSLANVSLLATPTTVRTRYNLNTGTSFVNAYTIPADDSLKVIGGTFTAPGLTIEGHLIAGGTTTIAAPVTMTPTGWFEARSSSELSSANITVVNGFANVGLIELIALNGGFTTTLAVTNGTLVNEATGVLRSVSGTGARTLAAQLDNRGLLDVPYLLTINRASAQHVNSGTIDLTTGNLTVTQTGSTPSFANTGSITLANLRTMTISGGTANLGGGTVTGATGTLAFSGTTINLGAGAVRSRINFGTGSSLGSAYTVPAGDTLRVFGGTLNGPGLTINGQVLVLASSSIAAPIISGTTGVLEIRSSGEGGSTNLTMPSSWTNNGSLLFNVLDASYTTTLTMTGQTLTNSATGTIDFVTGNNAGTRTFAGTTLDNFGTVLVNRQTNVNASFQQRGLFTVNSPHTAAVQTLTLQPGSTTTVNGTLNVTTCSNLGGTIGGPGSGTWTTACQ